MLTVKFWTAMHGKTDTRKQPPLRFHEVNCKWQNRSRAAKFFSYVSYMPQTMYATHTNGFSKVDAIKQHL